MPSRSVAVFDLGGVLIDWNPRHLYRKFFGSDEDAMEHFLGTVCTPTWNAQQDAGRTFAEGSTLLKQGHPQHAELIDAWLERYDEMLGGAIEGTVEILRELHCSGVLIYALSNWSTETFPMAQNRFEFLRWFNGILLSGNVGLIKPDPRIFKLFLETYSINPKQAIYIDDVPQNVSTACKLGMHGIHFKDAASLRRELLNLELLSPHRMGDWTTDRFRH